MALQIENGQFTRISNEILEELVKGGLLGSEVSLILFVIRKTYGFNKTSDIISLTQFEKGLNLSRHTVIKTIKNLVLKKILVKSPTLDKQKIAYKFNKYHQEWLVNPPALVQNNDRTSAKIKQKLVNPPAHTKDITKENKKEISLKQKWKQVLANKNNIIKSM